jgi:hypothetical protein
VVDRHIVVNVRDLRDVHPGVADINVLHSADWCGTTGQTLLPVRAETILPHRRLDSDAKAATANESHERR